MESLELRALLSGAGEAAPTWRPTTTDLHDAQNGPLAIAGKQLITTYFNYESFVKSGKTVGFDESGNNTLSDLLVIHDNYVNVDIRGYGDQANFGAYLQAAGMRIGTYDANLQMFEGALPIGQLPAVAALPQIVNIMPVFQPHVNATAPVNPPVSGVAGNQSDQVLAADAARRIYGVNGTGVTVGVLSDSANRYAGGLADSIRTGDLPANVRIINDSSGQPADGSPGDTDEGRAMMEQIHDIAPGANLLFASASNGGSPLAFPLAGELYFASNIRNLAAAGSKIIVDDVGYPTEPFYQDGPAATAVTDVTANSGVSYFSSAGNSASGGYQSQFRGVNATVTGAGSGRFMNFNPNPGAAATKLRVTVSNDAQIVFQYDQPFYTNNGVTSDVRIFFVDTTTGQDVALDTTNKIAQKAPFALVQVPAGTYDVSIKVLTGNDVGHVTFFEANGTSIAIDKSFGTAGGTFYPTTFGHPTAAAAIGVGAVPWFDAAPFNIPAAGVKNEQFSSSGPAIRVFNSDGSRLPVPQILQKPDISAPDGNDTSFFPPGGQLQTVNPPGSTGPATPTELDGNAFPNFFGTSSAAPNLAAVAALMKQLNPTASPADIRTALLTTTTPLNGQLAGSYDVQAGFGLAQAPAALAAVDVLKVQAVTPPAGQVATTAPQFIVLSFNKAINFATVQASDLVFTTLPPGASIVVGTPVQISPTTVQFPITLTTATPDTSLNGIYGFTIAAGSILSLDGKPVTAYSQGFAVQDSIPPQVTGTTFLGRIVVVQFSKAMRGSTINKSSIGLYRGTSSLVNVLDDPRASIFYDSTNNRAIIDLNAVDQASLPSDRYILGVNDNATDVVGNRLDGEFIGLFPSGNTVPGGLFFQDLGPITLSPPIVNSLTITGSSDTGFPGDQNTALPRPVFTGSIRAPFPATVANVQVAIQFSGPRGNTNDLAVGLNGRGFVGTPDLIVTTDANGAFSFTAPFNLADGLQSVRVVVIGQSDLPVQAGLSSQFDDTFRIDTSNPTVTSTTPGNGAPVSQLTSLTLNIVDPVKPTENGNPLGVPTQLNFPALDPATANNISNYVLFNLGPNRTLDNFSTNYSSFIQAANFVPTTLRAQTGDPYTGRIDLTLAPGLPSGLYALFALGFNPATGRTAITDAAGNPLDGDLFTPGLQNFYTLVDLQPSASFITSMQSISTNANGQLAFNGPKAFYEVPSPGTTARADAPPTSFNIDFSTPLNPLSLSNESVQLLFSPDGAFDGAGANVTRVAGTSVQLTNSIATALNSSMPGFQNRLVLRIAANTTLGPGHYRLAIPNADGNKIIDLFGAWVDGEFRGTPTAGGGFEDLLPNGQYRSGLSGDATPGGAFQSGFVVVPNGNVIFARPDYVDQAFNTADDPDGSLAKPYPTLAPQARANALNGGDLNSFLNFGTGFEAATQDREQSGHFDRSAFFAAQLAAANGPVVVVALPALAGTKTFVLNLPPQTDPNDPSQVLNGSASVPFNTTLVFNPGSTMRLYNAALFAQNQGSAIQLRGTPQQRVTFTSFYDPQFGSTSPTAPRGGDWGGIVFRNFDQGGGITNTNGVTTPGIRPDLFPIDGQLKGANGGVARVGADDAMSMINFALLRYGGGSVPQTQTTGFDVVDMFNSRPTVVNTVIADSQPPANDPTRSSGAQGAIGADFDSFREDDLARGPLIRRNLLINNSINGVLLRAQPNGAVQQTNAVLYPDNPLNRGGARNFVFDSPIPFVLASRFELGNMYLQDTGNQSVSASNRTYIQPGMLFKFERGAGLDVFDSTDIQGRHTSLNVGTRNYISQFDANPFFGPINLDGTPNAAFQANTVGDAQVLFTSYYDDNAKTQFIDPVTGLATVIVAPNDTDNGGTIYLPTAGSVPDNARWGGFSIRSGAVANIDEATFQFGGGSVNTPGGTIGQRAVLNFQDARAINNDPTRGTGTHVSITNNNFFDNVDTAMNITPNGLLAADPLRPLISGKPFFRGNVMQRNGFNGLGVVAGVNIDGAARLSVNSVWDSTDLTYVLRGTIVLTGANTPRLPSSTQFLPEQTPFNTLTIQSLAPNTLLANGQFVAKPGESTTVKLLLGAPTKDFSLTPTINSAYNAGAGFIVGADNGVDPSGNDALLDPGLSSQIRILGVGGNEALGQSRVPVIITSAHDSTVGTTVRGVVMNQLITGDTQAPAAGDGGSIYFGAHSLYTYNLYDLREGNRIDNADLRYMSRVEYQSGGVIDVVNGVFDPSGTTPLSQNNAKPANAISNSNLANFRDVGVYSHPGFANIQHLVASINGTVTDLGYDPARIVDTRSFRGSTLFMFNNTVSNTPIGVQLNGTPLPNNVFIGATDGVFLNNTFYNNPQGIRADGVQGPVGNFLAMDNIFSNSTIVGITNAGGTSVTQAGAVSQYNAFFQNGSDTNGVDNQPTPQISGDPLFRNPTVGNFNLNERGNGLPSSAIDSARSELGPSFFGGLLTPIATQQFLPGTNTINPNATSIRNATNRNGTDFVALPGFNGRNFRDQFQASVTSAPGGLRGPASNAATFNYVPTIGQRDQAGFLRQDDPGVPNVGFGSQPFFDIGAFEYRQLFPPHVNDVKATTATNLAGATIYKVGGLSGANQSPTSLRVQFNNLIDPTTITAQSVTLQASGGDGIFGNGNSPLDRFINLSGKLSFDNATQTLIIDLASSGLTLTNDEYRLVLLGTGANVLRDPQGNILDGENIDPSNTNANTNQAPLPSGDGVPGGNFQVTFTIDTNPPTVVNGTFVLAPASDSNQRDNVTNAGNPSFQGTIRDIFPPTNPLQGQTVTIAISTRGDGVYDRPNAGTATTDANGNFVVTVGGAPLADSPYNVGADGVLHTADDSGYSVAVVIVTDQSGNVSTPAFTGFVVDKTRPVITESTPEQNSVVAAANGRVQVSFGVNENVDPNSINAANITAARSGGDGIFGAGGPNADVPLTIDPASIRISYLGGAKGQVLVTLDILGVAANDSYQVKLGPGVTDLAGNPIVGNDATGTNYLINFLVFSQTLSSTIFVAPPSGFGFPGTPTGSINSPFTTINAGLAAAKIGDIVAVLPGVYNETVNLKAQVRLVSAAVGSTSGAVIPGNPLATIIRPDPSFGSGTATVVGNNLVGIPGIATEISGFTIASPLGGFGQATGPIVSGSVGIALTNSSVLVDKNYIINSDRGVFDAEGANSLHSQFQNNVFVGNNNALVHATANLSATDTGITNVINNTFAFNTIGVYDIGVSTAPTALFVANNIFWQNDRQQIGAGAAIAANYPGKMTVVGNMFSTNGVTASNPAGVNGVNVGNGFNPDALSGTPDAGGNFLGNPAFVSARDPRGQFDGPAVFFREANFDLSANSAAIDSAINSLAPTVDILSRGRVEVPNRGVPFGGPADVGAYEYQPLTGGTRVTPSLTTLNSRSLDFVGTQTGASLAKTTVNNAFTTKIAPAVQAESLAVVPAAQAVTPTPTPTPTPTATPAAVPVTPAAAAAPVSNHPLSKREAAVQAAQQRNAVRRALAALRRKKH